jgi:hypothetical protein
MQALLGFMTVLANVQSGSRQRGLAPGSAAVRSYVRSVVQDQTRLKRTAPSLI